MNNYELKDNVVAHFPAIFKGVGSKPSVIHLALDVELLGAVLVARVACGRPIHYGKCSRRTIIELARELVAQTPCSPGGRSLRLWLPVPSSTA